MNTAGHGVSFSSHALPSLALAREQSQWLLGARARLLRRAGIAGRRRVVDLGCGWAEIADELRQRSGGEVISIDCQREPLLQCRQRESAGGTTGGCTEASTGDIVPLVAAAEQLPIASESCDLVFCQFAMLWFREPAAAIREAMRVLRPGGVLCAIEPDYGGLMEWPPETAVQGIWLAALERAGAHPSIGRQLPALMSAAGFGVEVQFLDQLRAPDAQRYSLLAELPLERVERAALDAAAEAATRTPEAVAHLPLWMALGQKTAEGQAPRA